MTFHESDIDREIRSMPANLQHLGSDPVARGRILNVLIRRAVLSRYAQRIGLESDPLIASRITRARNTILIEALENWQSSRIKTPDDATVKQYYKSHLADFTIPEQVHARHILVASEKLAWKIIGMLQKNRDSFEVLAATHSLDDSNKSRGGDLNWFPRGVMVPEFEKIAFTLKEGGLSKPVKTQFGWHVIEVLGKRPAHVKPLEESKEEIINALMQQSLQEWIDQQLTSANVSILKPEYRAADEQEPETEQ